MLIKSLLLSALTACVSATSLTTIFQFPNGIWLDNLVIRFNGAVLTGAGLTNSPPVNTRPGLYQISNQTTIQPSTSVLVYDIGQDRVNAILGIAEVTPNVYAFGVGNFTYSNLTGQRGSWSIVYLDLTNYNPRTNTGSRVVAKVSVPNARTLHSVRRINNTAVLATDSGTGVVYRVDYTSTQVPQVVILGQDLTAVPSVPGSAPVGIVGSRINSGFYYYTSPFHGNGLFGRVQIDTTTGIAQFSTFQNITTDFRGDDFDIDQSGNAWVASRLSNAVYQVLVNSRTDRQAITGLTGPTATQFTTNFRDLFISTSGSLREGGRILDFTF